jgi:adenylosuccinate synthase
MHELNQLEDKGHRSINGMIEKCAALALQFHGEMDAQDEMEDGDHNDASVIASNLGQEDPPDPPAAARI